jgi:hypothetical protein
MFMIIIITETQSGYYAVTATGLLLAKYTNYDHKSNSLNKIKKVPNDNGYSIGPVEGQNKSIL